MAATRTAKATEPAGALELSFTFEKDTPGTFRFKEDEPEDGSRPAIGTLYITKKALTANGLKGKRIRVLVEDDE